MKLSHIRDLVAVAQRGGIRAAARNLGLAQPAISRSVRELERELGVSLFERGATGMTLTPAGEAFYKRARAIQSDIDRACDEARQLSGAGVGTITVGLGTAPLIALLPKVLEPLQRRFPAVELTIEEGLFPAMEGGIREGSIDFYVGPPNELSIGAEFAIEKLMDNRRIIIGRRHHPLVTARTLADLEGAKWVGTSVTSDHSAELAPLFAQYDLPPPTISVRTRSGLSAMMVTASTDLLALLPRQWESFARRTDLLGAIAVREDLSAPPICLIARAALPMTPMAQYLADQFRRAAQHDVPLTVP